MEALSLYELNNRVRQVLQEELPDEYWVQAELSEVREATNGHCYIELVQKEARGNGLLAKARGTIWNNVYRLLKPYFLQETGQAFGAGLKVQLLVTAEFHELYGYSLTVRDIDPTYTLGDLARRRREILLQLQEEGVLNLNKELPLPLLPQRVAVISSATAAGYGDFMNQLHNNPYGFVFYARLFPAVMQGEQVERSIIAALDAIVAERDRWDVVVIIRGGGGTSDLSGFDTYNLAANCAQFPLPILTGIGHERDNTVLDEVAHMRVKTPTAAAEFLINTLYEASEALEQLVDALASASASRMQVETQRLQLLAQRLPSAFTLRRTREENRLAQTAQRLQVGLNRYCVAQQHRLEVVEKVLDGASPQRILQRGYSLTFCNGKVVRSASQLQQGMRMETHIAEGTVVSRVEEVSSPSANSMNGNNQSEQ